MKLDGIMCPSGLRDFVQGGTKPLRNGNVLKWKFPLTLPDTGGSRVMAQVSNEVFPKGKLQDRNA
jgi:hypothetical protein